MEEQGVHWEFEITKDNNYSTKIFFEGNLIGCCVKSYYDYEWVNRCIDRYKKWKELNFISKVFIYSNNPVIYINK